MWDDFSFRAYLFDKEEEMYDINFSVDINDPLYLPLNRLLLYQNPIVIDDDETYGLLRKYMEIKKENDLITIKFINKMYEDSDYDKLEKWSIFIKNIFSDSRSKIEDDNIKYKLIELFTDVQDLLINNYYQINIDDYLEILNHSNKIKGIGSKED